ncbi:MAG: YceI family protein [Cyclobacteriaceae bacterium]|nr:YceI family protein [Cyclobacteriaceae bacterium]
MKNLIFSGLFFISQFAIAQKYISETSTITFFSDASLEDIAATNKKAVSLYDVGTNAIAFSIPMKEFMFDKSLMQEHFNEKYVESEKFPKATFEGKVTGFDVSKKGLQQVIASGKITIHGKTKPVEIPGTLEVVQDKLQLKTKFKVKLEDYEVTIPKLLWQKIAEEVEVSMDVLYKVKPN